MRTEPDPLPVDPESAIVEAPDQAAPAADDGSGATRRAVLMAALITVAGIFGSRLLGLVRVMVQSRVFGAEDAGILRAAFDIPDLLFYLVAGGALRSGFVPVFTELLTRGRNDSEAMRRAWWLFSVLITAVAAVSTGLVLIGVWFAEDLAILVTGGWSDQGFSEEGVALTIFLTRIILPAQVFLLIGGVFSGTLDSLKRFTVTALVPNFYNLSIILAMLLLGKQIGITSAAVGVVFGAFFGHLLWQGWSLWRHGSALGFRYTPSLKVSDPDVQRVLRIAAPIVLGLCVAEVNLKISGWVHAQFGEAARNWFDNASRIARLPDGIFGAGLGIALFPFLSQLAAERKYDEFRVQAEHILRLALVCTLPCVAVLAGAALPIVDLLFGGGAYTPEDVLWTARLLPLFAIGIVPITLQVVITRAFYARQDSITPVKIGAVTVLLGIGANIWLARVLGVYGAALALSLTSVLNVVGLVWLYSRRFGFDDVRGLWSVALRATLAAVGSGAVTVAVVQGLAGLHELVLTLLALGLGMGVYVVLARWLRVEEITEVASLLKRRFGRRRGRP